MIEQIDNPLVLERIRSIEWFVSTLNLEVIWQCYGNRGTPPYPPDAMLRIVLYELLDQRPSPNHWHRDLATNLALKYLGRQIQPARTTLYDFRDRAGKFIENVHAQLIRTAMRKNVLEAKRASIDGTLLRSIASRHRIVNQTTLRKRLDQLKMVVATEMQGIPVNIDDIPRWMGRTTRGRREQLKRFEQAFEILCKRVTRNSQKKSNDKLPVDKVFVSTSDPEAVISRDKEKIFGPLYTSQYVTDNDTGLILASELFVQATDVATIGRMIDLVQEYTGRSLLELYADAAYTSTLDLIDCDKRNINLYAPVGENSFSASKKKSVTSDRITRDAFHYVVELKTYTCPSGHPMPLRHTAKINRFDGAVRTQSLYQMQATTCQSCPLFSKCVKNGKKSRTITRIEGQEFVDAQKAKMTDEVCKKSRAIRAQTAEKTNADIKIRTRLARLTSYTSDRSRTVLALHTVAFNVLLLYRLIQKRPPASEKPT